MVFLIPTVLADDALETIPPYVVDAVKQCSVFFVENERTARRFLKSIWKEMVIDDQQWYTIHQAEEEVIQQFLTHVRKGDNIGIMSEAGCPGVADPGQRLVTAAQLHKAIVKPLVGPSSILLALMASGMNGQSFRFHGYLPIETNERKRMLQQLEAEALKQHCTQIFIETPYRNDALVRDVLQTCKSSTRLCIAVDITSPSGESIITKSISEWKNGPPALHKRPAIFLIGE